MSAKCFLSIDETIFANSFIKRDFSDIYHQQGANLSHSDKNINLFFGENNNYYQRGNAYLLFELTLMKSGCNFEDDYTDSIRLVNHAFAHLLKEATIMTMGGSEIEESKYVGPVSTITRVLTSKDGDFSSNFVKFHEDTINDTTLTEILIDNHTKQDNKENCLADWPWNIFSHFVLPSRN